MDCETYLHRIGRSGRFGKGGLAINFAGPDDENLLQQIENHFGENRKPPSSQVVRRQKFFDITRTSIAPFVWIRCNGKQVIVDLSDITIPMLTNETLNDI